jgi:putative ABC transport system permease protein
MNDLKFALRQLLKNPGFATVAVLTLALGIGASTTVFTVVNAVCLKPLPYEHPDRLLAVELLNTRDAPAPGNLSYPDFFDFRQRNHVFDHFVTGRDVNLTLTGFGPPMQLDGQMVTWDLFSALGKQPELGRGFLPGEEAPGTHVVVLSHEFWQTQFGSDRNIIGRTIDLNREPYTVVGVAPIGFVFPANEPNIQIWTTIAVDQSAITQRGARMLEAIGRLKPGVDMRRARADLDVIAAALAAEYPESNANYRRAFVRPALETLVGQSRAPLMILLAAVGLVLMIACANIMNLLLARTVAREHEMAVRGALGAGRKRLIRQLLTESLLLAFLGGLGGVILAACALRGVILLGGPDLPRLAEATIDTRVLGFSSVLVLFTSIAFGMFPALQAAKIDLSGSLREKTSHNGPWHERLRGALVVVQVTLGVMLVSGAGLLMASFLHLQNGELGLNPDNLLSYRFTLPESRYNAGQQVIFYDRLLDAMRDLPGVQSAAGVWPLPLSGDSANVGFDIEGRPVAHPNEPQARMAFATPGYFSTAGITLLSGRFFAEQDAAKAPQVLIVNKAFADKFFPGEAVIGKRITPGAGAPGENPSPHEIVGVVGNAKLFATDAAPQPMYYFPYKQLPWFPPAVVLRTVVPPRTLQSAIRKRLVALDPAVPVFQTRTMNELLSAQITGPRFQMLLLNCFAASALLLTMVGLYGVMAYSVTRRTPEIGVRIALGASRTDVLFMVLKQAVTLLATGLVLGLLGSLAGARALQGVLYGVRSLSPAVSGLSGLLVAVTGLLAAYLPARRAAKVDPIVALHYE